MRISPHLPVRSARRAPALAAPPLASAHTRPVAPRPVDARAERIEHWLRGVQEGTLANLRGAASAYAGQMVGMAVGAVLFAPAAVATGNVFVFFGGASLLGCAGAYAGYQIDRKQAQRQSGPDRLTGAALAAGTAVQALPKFAYPSLLGASTADRAVIMGALDKMPMGSVTSLSHVQVLSDLTNTGASGMALPAFSQNGVLLDRESLHYWGWGEELVAHEVGHTRDFDRVGYGVFGGHSLLGPFGRAPYITSYAGTNRLEDFAETHALYHTGQRSSMEARTPAKLQAMEALHQQGLGERFAERPEVRQAGRDLGRALEAVPYLRQGLELAGGLVAPIQVRRGARKLEDGFLRGDEAQKFHGKMNLASGLMILAPAGPVGALITSATHAVVGGLVQDGKLSLERANSIGNGALAIAAGPLGMVGSAVIGELSAGGVSIQRASYQPGEHPTGKPDPSRPGALPWLAAGISGGIGLGATLGALTGGALGAVSGMFWGPLAGTALALGAFALTRPEPVPGKLDLTRDDRMYLARVIGGGALGGTLGALGGGELGGLAGTAAGGAMLGPAGAVTGAWVGRFAGMMLGSLALGRAGAWAGRKLDDAF
ncbi:hypothetical protein DYH09_30670 [bacterium CPR1]|nr:hypothetical protein [bacterium CPR1]